MWVGTVLGQTHSSEAGKAPPLTTDHLSGLLSSVGSEKSRSAYRTLFDHFGPRLKSFYIRSGSDEVLAEELVQETFLQIWRKAHLYDAAKAAASTWIFTVARNIRIDKTRNQNRLVLKDETFFETAMVDDGDQDRVTYQTELMGVVREAIAELPPNQAEVISLSFFEDATHADIAQRLQLPLGTVKSRLRLAFGRLRSKLSEFE